MPLNIEYMKSRSLGAATGGSVGVSIWIHSRLLQNSTHLLRDSAISSSEHSSAAAPSVTAHFWQSVPTATPPLRVDDREGKAVALNFDAHFAGNTTQRSYMLSSIPRLSSRSPPRGALVVARLHRAPLMSDSSHIGMRPESQNFWFGLGRLAGQFGFRRCIWWCRRSS